MPGRFTEQAFPIFNSDNYWKEKFDDYKVGKFDNYELQFISNLLTKNADGSYEAVKEESILNTYYNNFGRSII